MQKVVIYKDLKGFVSRNLLVKWIIILVLIADKVYVNNKIKWIKVDVIKGNESLPFTFFKETEDRYRFQLEYLRVEKQGEDLIDGIEFLLIEAKIKGEKYEISGHDRRVHEFGMISKNVLDGYSRDEFLLYLQKETLMGKINLLIEKLQNARDTGDKDRTEKYMILLQDQLKEINSFTLKLREGSV